MCVAAIISKPVTMTQLQQMEDDNPHGAGVAWADDGQLFFSKGLGAKEIFELQEAGWLTFPYLLHFRWATHGARTMAMTHPFPLGPRALLGELDGHADKLMIHNGVWHGYKDFLELVDADPDLISKASDTAIAAYLTAWLPNLPEEMPWAVAIGSLAEDGTMKVERFGMCWEEHEGNLYSNLSWIPRERSAAGWDFDVKAWLAQAPRTKPRDYSEGWQWEASGDTNQANEVPDEDVLTRPVYTNTDWDDYIRARYGDDVLAEVKRDSITMEQMEAAEMRRELNDEENPWDAQIQGFLDDVPPDEPSDDFDTVNEFLAQQSQRIRCVA